MIRFPIRRIYSPDTDFDCNDRVVTIHDATLEPLRVMALAWETMLGHPDIVLEGFRQINPKEMFEEILKAKHKTVMEYIALSIEVENFKLDYITGMASCRAGFSVIALPKTFYQGQWLYSTKIGCTYRALYDWMKVGVNIQSIEHSWFCSLIIEAMWEYNGDLATALMDVCYA
jgi:hypothetical protein